MRATSLKAGFSLVELSIVLVILGLLVGGILAGQSLIRASELRAVSSESQRYSTAINAFKDKYFSIPGDFKDATSFGSSTWVGNGDANGQIGTSGTPTANEISLFWIHLGAAGLIEGQYTNVGGTTMTNANRPSSKMTGAGWNVGWLGAIGNSDTTYFDGSFGNVFYFGGGSAYNTPGKILRAEEAWNVDTKMDDGRPASGSMVTFESQAGNTGTAGACSNGASSGGATMAASTYALDTSTVNCSFIVKSGY